MITWYSDFEYHNAYADSGFQAYSLIGLGTRLTHTPDLFPDRNGINLISFSVFWYASALQCAQGWFDDGQGRSEGVFLGFPENPFGLPT